MKLNLNKLCCLILALCSYVSFAFAEGSAVDTILTAGTTQAFTQEAVSDADLDVIVQAGLAATSAINQQPWYFAVITNQEVMAELGSAQSMPGAMPGAMPEGMSFPEGGATPPEGESFPEAPDMAGSSGASSGMPAMPAMSTGAAKAALGDSPVAIVIYMDSATASPNASFDCGLACQNMVIAANALGYGTKIISSPTNVLNGEDHDRLCQLLGVDPALQAVAVLLIGHEDATLDATTTASVRSDVSEKVSFVH